MTKNDIFLKDKNVIQYYKNISLTPFVIDNKQYLDLAQKTEKINKIIQKTIKLFLSDKRIRDFFSLSQKELSLILSRKDCTDIYIARYDCYISKENQIKFLEFNTDFPVGLNRYGYIEEKILKLLNNNKLHKSGKYLELFKQLIIQISNKYKGIMVISHGNYLSEEKKQTLNFYKKIIQDLGVSVEIASWKEFDLIEKQLYLRKKKVGFIFRAELFQRIVDDYDDFKNILEALKNNNVFLFNPLIASIIGMKSLFVLWNDKYFLSKLSKDEAQLLSDLIPKTFYVESDNLEEIVVKKNNMVIKPIHGHGGIGVYIGKNFSHIEWKKIVTKNINNKYIAQEYIEPLELNIDTVNTSTSNVTKIKNAKININPWVINGAIAGISGRYSTEDVINVRSGAGIISILVNYK